MTQIMMMIGNVNIILDHTQRLVLIVVYRFTDICIMTYSIAFIENGSVESLWDVKTRKELQDFCEDEGWAVVSKSKNK